MVPVAPEEAQLGSGLLPAEVRILPPPLLYLRLTLPCLYSPRCRELRSSRKLRSYKGLKGARAQTAPNAATSAAVSSNNRPVAILPSLSV
jgi:hypothetical protein